MVSPDGVLVIKIGSSSLVRLGDGPDPDALERVVEHVAQAFARGHPTALVTSGAVAAGLPALGLSARPTDLAGLQVAAAVGQGRLMGLYTAEFAKRGLVAGQVLLTRGVLADRTPYLNARMALLGMLERGIVPVVNENDSVGVEELRVGDNDRLSALVSHLVSADLLILLTDTPGLYTADPSSQDAELMGEISGGRFCVRTGGGSQDLQWGTDRHLGKSPVPKAKRPQTDQRLDSIARLPGGQLGSGGVFSKVAAARMAAFCGIPTVVAFCGIPTVVASASEPAVVARICSGERIGTWVNPQSRKLSARKLWIAFGQETRGQVTVDAGAVRAITQLKKSLLPVGVRKIERDFDARDAVQVLDSEGRVIAKGISRITAHQCRAFQESGKPTVELIHRDDLVVLVE